MNAPDRLDASDGFWDVKSDRVLTEDAQTRVHWNFYCVANGYRKYGSYYARSCCLTIESLSSTYRDLSVCAATIETA